MCIGELIKDSLKDIGIPAYYLKRSKKIEECVVYNYTEAPNSYADMEELSTKYTVLLNVYCKTSVEDNKKKIKDAMLEAGFKKILILATQQEENEIYNTAMQFKIGMLNKD